MTQIAGQDSTQGSGTAPESDRVRVIREDGTVIMPPSATLRIDRGDRVTIIGRSEGIRRFASS